MNTSALVMMIIALLLVWGGLVAALVHLRANPDHSGDDDGPGDGPPPA
ncbi:methionine/alanine import family NSS transporter small subunit [Pseudactinotalea sp. HY158]|nr:methionine/alanine import family NSS transporter small subunit [Pseudactinotalea sp. HY158]QGH70658.1 methionine/alanine import family NSS transporter small subunit [Pseudactinotalea sp. HY158]